jgi:hypothetical protein
MTHTSAARRGARLGNGPQMIPVNLNLPFVALQAIDKIAIEAGYTRAALIRLALFNLLDHAERPEDAEGRAQMTAAIEALARTSIADGQPFEPIEPIGAHLGAPVEPS